MRNQNAVKPSVENRFDALKIAALNKAEKDAVIKLALSVLKDRHRAGRALGSPGDTRAYLRLKLAERKNEVFGSLFLDTRNRIIEDVELFHGTIDGASVHPRVVVQRALQSNAGSVVLYHNHPSGVAEPSHADEAITRRLRDVLSLVDVRVLDHFVVAAGDSVSFAEKGLL